jgi:hypothetical protein
VCCGWLQCKELVEWLRDEEDDDDDEEDEDEDEDEEEA